MGLVHTSDDVENVLTWARNVPDQLIGLDVETDGLDWFDGKLRLVQFGTPTEGWAVPFGDFRFLVKEILRILDERGKVFVGHNFKFDLHWIERNTGWMPREWAAAHDTMLLAAVLNSSGAKGLKDLSEFYVWSGAKGGQKALHDDMKRGGWDWGTVPIDLPSYWIYGVLDTIMTVALFWVLYEKAEKAGCLGAYETERAATPALYAIERNGMLLDSEHVKLERDKLRAACVQIEEAVAQYGISNIDSTPQIALAFLNAGIELSEKTDTGKWKMDRDTFDIIAATNDHPLVNMVKTHRSATKMASTYYDNFLKYQRSDGRIHPFYRPVVARTGRMSASEPAILTVPRPGTNSEVRNSIVAPDGHVIVSTDFSNVEARVFAHYAGETGMIQAFKDGVDLHSYTAKEIFQLDYMPGKDDPQRQIAKNTLFCLPTDVLAMTQDGPTHVDHLKVGQLVAGFNGSAIDWTPVRAIHRPGAQEVITFGNRYRQLRATADHRWFAERRVDHGNRGRRWEPVVVTTAEFLRGGGDVRLVLSAQFDQQDRSGLTPAQASLLGWLITDGHVRWSTCTSGRTSQAGGSKVGVQAFIAQTKQVGRHAIESSLSEFVRRVTDTGYHVHPQHVRDLFEVCGLKRDYSNLEDIVRRMGMGQIQEFMVAVWWAEGTLDQNRLSQNEGPKYDAIRLGCFMNGMFPGRSRIVHTSYDTLNVCRSFTRGSRMMTAAKVQVFDRTVEDVWCITTDLDSFVAVDGETYFLTKNCTLFGGGAAKVAITAGIPLAEGERSIKGLYAAFPGIKDFQKRSIQIATDNLNAHGQAFVRGLDGRVLAMVETDDRYYAFTNWQIQSAACIILKRRLAVLDSMGMSKYLIAAIHDEVVAEIPEEFEEEYGRMVTEAMEDHHLLSVPVVSATGHGAPRWGDAK